MLDDNDVVDDEVLVCDAALGATLGGAPPGGRTFLAVEVELDDDNDNDDDEVDDLAGEPTLGLRGGGFLTATGPEGRVFIVVVVDGGEEVLVAGLVVEEVEEDVDDEFDSSDSSIGVSSLESGLETSSIEGLLLLSCLFDCDDA